MNEMFFFFLIICKLFGEISVFLKKVDVKRIKDGAAANHSVLLRLVFVLCYIFLESCLMASNEVSLMLCSILQASSAAVFSSTPMEIRKFVKRVWRA